MHCYLVRRGAAFEHHARINQRRKLDAEEAAVRGERQSRAPIERTHVRGARGGIHTDRVGKDGCAGGRRREARKAKVFVTLDDAFKHRKWE